MPGKYTHPHTAVLGRFKGATHPNCAITKPRQQAKPPRTGQTGQADRRAHGAGGGGACGSSEARPREVGGTREQMASAEAWRRPATTVGTGLGWHSGPETRSTCNENVFTSETYLKSVHEI